METTSIDEIAKEFLGDILGRPQMAHFHKDGDNICASNGWTLLVANEKYFSGAYSPVDKYPDYKKSIPPHRETTIFVVSVDEIFAGYARFEKSERHSPCKTCDGEGSIECNLMHDHDCELCEGSGYSDEVTGYYIDGNLNAFKINEAYLSPDQLMMVARLANYLGVYYLPFHKNDPRQPQVIYVGDILTLVMPLTRDEDAEFTCILTAKEPPHVITATHDDSVNATIIEGGSRE